MDTSDETLTAEYVVNRYSRDELERIFREYGEERHSGRIAD
jgi:16S rRNA (cytosine1402-N4)-methyltransferase